MFSGVLDHLARNRFMSDSSGRLAVFPFGSRRPGYYVDASDESKIKSLVKLYVVAGALVNLVGSLSCYLLAQTQIDRSWSVTLQFERSAGVYAISAIFGSGLSACCYSESGGMMRQTIRPRGVSGEPRINSDQSRTCCGLTPLPHLSQIAPMNSCSLATRMTVNPVQPQSGQAKGGLLISNV